MQDLPKYYYDQFRSLETAIITVYVNEKQVMKLSG